MEGFFTPKTLATIGGVILSFVIPHVIFGDDNGYEIEYLPEEPDAPEDTTTTTTDVQSEETEEKE